VDESSSYDWNPLNFAFTAILSVLALGLAFLTLIQAFLASGPGRLKANLGAIGHKYHKTASTRFDRAEFRFRTTVNVPNINLDTILYQRQPVGFEDVLAPGELGSLRMLARLYAATSCLKSRQAHRQNLSREADLENLIVLARGKPSTEDQRPHASWGQLLFETALERLQFQTTECRTDYLPNEVQAAPAYASLEALLFLSIAVGCTSYSITERNVAALGPGVQLQMRDNQTIGKLRYFKDTTIIGILTNSCAPAVSQSHPS
jgi:hypothetical protein